MNYRVIFLIIFFAVGTTEIFGQSYITPNYYAFQPDEQSYFFKPIEFSEMQNSVFENIWARYSPDPLSSLVVNPSNIISFKEDVYAYGSYNSATYEMKEYSCFACYTRRNNPDVLLSSIQKPAFNSALIVSPFTNKRIKLGITYQYLGNGQNYYVLARPTYNEDQPHVTSDVSYNLSSSRAVFDDYDNLQTRAHFPSLYAGIPIGDRLYAGLKINYANYKVTGGQLVDGKNVNYVDDIDPNSGLSSNRNRNSVYDQWEYTLALNYNFSDHFNLGIDGGYLNGDFDQVGNENWGRENINVDETFRYKYYANNEYRADFIKTGDLWKFGIDGQYSPSNDLDFFINYRIWMGNQDLNYGLNTNNVWMNLTIQDPNINEINREVSNSESMRNTFGQGSISEVSHLFSFNFRRWLSSETRISSGIQVVFNINDKNVQTTDRGIQTSTDEETIDGVVEHSRFRRSESITEFIDESTLNQFSLYIPLIIDRQLWAKTNIQLGALYIFQETEITEKRNVNSAFEIYINDNGMESLLEDSNSNENSNTYFENPAYFNGFLMISFSPSNKVKLGITGFTNKRVISPSLSQNDIGFKVSTELRF